MSTFKLLLAATVFGGVFLLVTGLVDLGGVRDDGRFEWNPHFDAAEFRRLGLRAWHTASGAVRDAVADAQTEETAPAPQVTEQILVLH
jgi:hypothetical protein